MERVGIADALFFALHSCEKGGKLESKSLHHGGFYRYICVQTKRDEVQSNPPQTQWRSPDGGE